jgi:hypothetical protein|tara:strand:+ start:51 stop:467 length:417 start_codon:yes stop_codon:yes gene_type:complete
MMGRRLVNVLIGLITLWAIYIVVAWLFDLSIMFPYVQVEPEEIPMGRLHAIRLAVIGTFAFYGVMHLLQGSAEVFPIHFLKTFLFFLSIIGLAVAWKAQAGGTDVSLQHWALAFFWLAVALVLHFASPPRYRRYFRKK